MTQESKAKTLIEEARELAKVVGGYNHPHVSRVPAVLRALCDELDQQTSRIATQAENLATCHDRMKLQKEAILIAVGHIELEAESLHSALHVSESAAQKFAECRQKRCVTSRVVVKQLRSSITPKGEQSS